ncbi:hypothetical protein F5141DRAFT_988959, partial [Pisolithus sp. B1]
IVVPCADGIAQRVFPHFFSYSADYPKKVLIAGIKFPGTCPCPRCLTKKTNLHKMGMVHDMRSACRLIFEKGVSVDGERVKALLNEFLYVPTYVSHIPYTKWFLPSLTTFKNAFSDCLFQFGFNYFKLLLVNLLHKFELGVWKAIFTHLICILYAASGQGIQELNKRYV